MLRVRIRRSGVRPPRALRGVAPDGVLVTPARSEERAAPGRPERGRMWAGALARGAVRAAAPASRPWPPGARCARPGWAGRPLHAWAPRPSRARDDHARAR